MTHISGFTDQQMMDEGAIRSLLESSLQNTDVHLENIENPEYSYGACDPIRRSVLGEPWKQNNNSVGNNVMGITQSSLSKIPFRNASIVSKIISTDSSESVREGILSSPHDKSAPVTSLDRESNEDGNVEIQDDSKSTGVAGRASSAIIVKDTKKESAKDFGIAAVQEIQGNILIQRQQKEDEIVFAEKAAAEMRQTDRNKRF